MIVLARLGSCSLLVAAATSLSAVFVVLLPALQLRKELGLPQTDSHSVFEPKAKPMPRWQPDVVDPETSEVGRLLKPKPKPNPQPELTDADVSEVRLLKLKPKPKPKPPPTTFPETSEGLIDDALLHRSNNFRRFVDERVFLARTLHLLKAQMRTLTAELPSQSSEARGRRNGACFKQRPLPHVPMEFPLYFTNSSDVVSSTSKTTSDSSRKVVVWMHSVSDPEYFYIIWPLYATLGEALQGLGAQVQVSFRRHTALVERDVEAALAAGALPILIVLFWNGYELSHPGAYQDSLLRLQRLALAGAYMILYNTEPRDRVLMHAKPFAAKMNAREVWDYSLANLAHYKATAPGVLTRHVYPGCAHGMDFRVWQGNATENYDLMGFVGEFERRPPAVRELLRKSGLVRPMPHKVKNGSSWREYLKEFPVQLNLHQPWNTYGAFEVFRAAQLLANQACLFSQNSNELDMAFWKDMVHFGRNAALLDEFQAMRSNRSAIEACRKQGHEVFCSRMRPHQMLENSGFAAKLRELQVSHGTT